MGIIGRFDQLHVHAHVRRRSFAHFPPGCERRQVALRSRAGFPARSCSAGSRCAISLLGPQSSISGSGFRPVSPRPSRRFPCRRLDFRKAKPQSTVRTGRRIGRAGTARLPIAIAAMTKTAPAAVNPNRLAARTCFRAKFCVAPVDFGE